MLSCFQLTNGDYILLEPSPGKGKMNTADRKMKRRIASNMWERKKGLIVKLYQEERWPLKQVLKRVRSHTFNPR
jgi:hypothetical protein